MKNFSLIGILVTSLCVAGCSAAPEREAVPTAKIAADPSTPDATKKGMNNANIYQKMMQTGIRPDGVPLPKPGGK